MTNPYESPQDVRHEVPVTAAPPAVSGLVAHVKAVAILMIVQAALEILAGLGLAGLGIFMSVVIRTQEFGPNPPPAWFFLVVYVGMGVLLLVPGILLLIAGIKNLKYRGRMLGIVALGCTAVTIFTCYCAPTGIGLVIYGLIVYLNQDVAKAFAVAEAQAQTIA